ncbi:nicotinate-nucleotide adenylyltransferase [Mesobaculum littorinae]|uniref:Probable nicotinate-nucleotide adenylyltransferase n=1 Tax=Mesobaculum littorinae TaxID=2486419 RepID=A0A438AGR7_9RHOB|nr:nicotinate-nucleotide adenylyltransferase [Mesobaculum littorinae]RVV97767.1 nicotinate-nucleotide adenylyltransferase [Mesobaculum littorinae]
MVKGPGWPQARAGQAVGLLGGSFDPPHAGHANLTREALRRFGLDRVWWLVSPGNPLKRQGPAPMADRIAAARSLISHPKVTITDLEARLGTRYTAQTLDHLSALYPGVRFVWLMGADNLATIHLWDNWHRIMESVPVGILARPGRRISARTSPAASIYREARLPPSAARLLPRATAPAWCFVNIPMRADSSTALREGGQWPRPGAPDLRRLPGAG